MSSATKRLVTAALIAALYTGLTYLSSFFGLAFGPVQLRLSEALCVLSVFSPSAICGLSMGCLISNIVSFTPLDMVFGTSATALAALCSYAARSIKIKEVPMFSILMPVLFNALIIGAELTLFYSTEKAALTTFLLYSLWVALGEAAVCVLLGVPLYAAVGKNRLLSELLKNR